jgi:hypothetical protein
MIPIKFKEFASNPIVGTLFVVLIAIGYLYVDVRSTFQGQAKSQDFKILKLETRIDIVTDALRRCDSSLAAATTKLSTLEQLGKIQKIN